MIDEGRLTESFELHVNGIPCTLLKVISSNLMSSALIPGSGCNKADDACNVLIETALT